MSRVEESKTKADLTGRLKRLWRVYQKSETGGYSPRASLCENCGRGAIPATTEPGSRRLEIALWLLFVFPGAFYRLWRSYHGTTACSACGGAVELLHAETPQVRPLFLSFARPAAASVKFASWPRFGRHGKGELVSEPSGARVACGAVASRARFGIEVDLVTGSTSRQIWLPFSKSKFEYEGVRYVSPIGQGAHLGLIGMLLGALLGNHARFLVHFHCGDDWLVAELDSSDADALLARSLPEQWGDDAALLRDLWRSRLLPRIVGGTALAVVMALVAGLVTVGLGRLCLPQRYANAPAPVAIAAEAVAFVVVLWRVWRGPRARPKSASALG